MTSIGPTPPRRIRLGRWLVAVTLLAPLAALTLGAAPATGLDAEESLTAEPTPTSTSTATATSTSTATATSTPTATATPTTESPTTESPSPSPTADATQSPSTTVATTTAPSGSATATSDPTQTTTAEPALPLTALDPQILRGGQTALAVLGDPGAPPELLPAGSPADALAPFQTLRITVQLLNATPEEITVAPRLELRRAGTADEYVAVSEEARPGLPLHAAREWVAAEVGSVPAPLTAMIPVDELRLPAPDGLAPVDGRRSSGVNPAPAYAVPAESATEQEFTFALSIDAAYGTTYELRVTDAGEPIADLANVTIAVGPEPSAVTDPGQRDGVDVAPGTDAALSEATPTTSMTAYRLQTTAVVDADEVYVGSVGPSGPGTIHSPGGSTTSGQCSVCHQTHTARSQALSRAPTETGLCYSCHAGGTGGADVRAQYTLGQPENDPDTRSYWSHDTSDPGGHVLDSANEFAGTLSRHSQCSDCHDPHGATSEKAAMTPTGWTAPGGLAKTSGVAVSNGAAGTVPEYTWLDGLVRPVTAEYQLCFKCHSSYTTLPQDVPGKPSQRSTDLAVDFNPANPSYHPVEAPGRNQSQKLADSLAGPSSYKLWNFTTGDTIRCVSCHASNTTGTSADPEQNAPDATLTVHASTNRGILIRPYENRVLSKAGQYYDAKGAALCLTCHTDTPFMNRYRPAAATGTNFVFHGLHMSGITSKGSGGLDIDTPGDGQGNARCAECHFSSHGTTQLPDGQQVAGDRLVGFSPNVLPSKAMGGVPTFTKTDTGGTCTLTCHGKDHQGARYTADTP